MKKKVWGVILMIAGTFGFLLLLWSVGGVETGSADFIKGTYSSLIGGGILALVVFVGIPYHDNLNGANANGS